METQERGHASPEAELSFRSEQLRATVSLRKWRACAVAPGAAGFVGLEEEGAHQGGRAVDNFLALVLPLKFRLGTVCIGDYS